MKRLLSTDHFSVDGTLIEAWASMKSFKPKAPGGDHAPPPSGGRNADVDFKGQKRTNETHESTADPEEAKLCFIGHTLMENRSGLIVDTRLTAADGHAERIAALSMIERRADRPRAISVGADKAYDAENFVKELRSMNVRRTWPRTPTAGAWPDGQPTRHAGYGMSQTIRKRIEERFGWIKTVAGQRKTRFRGRDKVGWAFAFAGAAYNLVRLPKLLGATA